MSELDRVIAEASELVHDYCAYRAESKTSPFLATMNDVIRMKLEDPDLYQRVTQQTSENWRKMYDIEGPLRNRIDFLRQQTDASPQQVSKIAFILDQYDEYDGSGDQFKARAEEASARAEEASRTLTGTEQVALWQERG